LSTLETAIACLIALIKPQWLQEEDHNQAASPHNIARRMLVWVAVGDQSAAPLGLGEVIGWGWFDQSIGQNPLKRLARYIATGERAIEPMSALAVNRFDFGSLECRSVECSPRGRLFVARADPFLAKGLLPARKQAQIVAHAAPVIRDKACQPAVMVAVPVAEDQAV
jgi:hypothetical protein